MPSGALVFPERFSETKSSNSIPVVEMCSGHAEAESVTVSRPLEMQTVLEHSNYLACICFEKHAGAIIYSALRHFLEWILQHSCSHGS